MSILIINIGKEIAVRISPYIINFNLAIATWTVVQSVVKDSRDWPQIGATLLITIYIQIPEQSIPNFTIVKESARPSILLPLSVKYHICMDHIHQYTVVVSMCICCYAFIIYATYIS